MIRTYFNRLSRAWPALLLAMLAMPVVQGCATAPQRFDNPKQAVDSLISAARAHSTEQLLHLLGSDAEDIFSSGDEVADRGAMDRFVEAYDQKHQLVPEENGRVTLVVGTDDWPLPIPIVRSERGNGWQFDTEAGRDELINRRIGSNELDAIQVCLAIADAQREYAQRDPQNAGLPLYATKVASDPGTRNGLYWSTDEGERPSPLGPLVANATEEGYTPRVAGEVGPQPYHGYMYRLLTTQGQHASGGACDYMINGKLLGGFGVVAFPAQYGVSGIMTFIVNHEGAVYEQDLGDDTDTIARSMTVFDPGPDWRKVATAANGHAF